MAFQVQNVITRESAIWQTLAAWPKVELHRHLEGALRLSTLIEVARQHAIPLPAYSLEALRPYVQITETDAANVRVFLGKFEVLRQFYRSLDIIQRIAREAVEDAAADNVRYMELRFTPHALARLSNLRYADVIRAVCDAVSDASRQSAITVRLIISVNRHESVEIAQRVLEAAIALRRPEIVALDLAGPEVGFPAQPFRALFARAQAAGLHITVHAGEWDGPANVREAIEVLDAERVGHGVRAAEDADVVRLVRDRGITLEICPTSNMQSGVVRQLRHHPLIDLSYVNVRTTINTDDPGISGIFLTDELALAHVGLGLTLDRLRLCILNGARAAFLPHAERDALVTELTAALGGETLRPPLR